MHCRARTRHHEGRADRRLDRADRWQPGARAPRTHATAGQAHEFAKLRELENIAADLVSIKSGVADAGMNRHCRCHGARRSAQRHGEAVDMPRWEVAVAKKSSARPAREIRFR